MIDDEIVHENVLADTGDDVSNLLADPELGEIPVVYAEIVEDPRLFLETPFEEFTVTEGLLLTLFLCVFVSAVIKLLKEGFYWLW